MSLDYTKKVIELFQHPKNVGEIKNPDGVGTKGGAVCGDLMTIYIKVKNNRITNVKFKTWGCAAAIASSSALTEMVKGMTLDEAEKITNDDIVRFLGGLPIVKIHCSLLAVDALKNAIKDYKKKS